MFAQISLNRAVNTEITAKDVNTRPEGGTLDYIQLEFQQATHAANETQVSWINVNLNDNQAEDIYHQIGRVLSERSLRQLTAHYPDAPAPAPAPADEEMVAS